jgi:hypothetical protein
MTDSLRAKVRTATGRSVAPGATPGWAWNRLGDPASSLDWKTARVRASLHGWRQRTRWPEVERFCFFVGYPRSGHSLVGSLLNAHPDAVIAHELGMHRYLAHGFSREQLFGLILERDRSFGSMGRRWTGYDYDVPGQFQGSVRRLRVIGDKLGRATSRVFGADPDRLDQVRDWLVVPIRVLHVTRNPFDNIATMARRNHTSLAGATEQYGHLCELVDTVRGRLRPDELLDLTYESFTADPARRLPELCAFLGLDAPTDYVEACAGVVWGSEPGGDAPRPPSRRRSEWQPVDVRRVEALIDRYDVLTGYRFDS